MYDGNSIQLHPLILTSCRADSPSPPSLSLLITIGLLSSVGARSGKTCPDGDVKSGRYEIFNKIYFNVTCLGYAFLANRSVQYNSSDGYDTLTLRRKEHAIHELQFETFRGAASILAASINCNVHRHRGRQLGGRETPSSTPP